MAAPGHKPRVTAAAELEAAVELILDGLGAGEARAIVQGDSLDSDASNFLPPTHASLTARLEWLLAELDPRAAEVLRSRCGIGQDYPETLEEIGARYGVTRERIRQIEAKALKRLRKRVRRVPIDALLAAEADKQWNLLAERGPILSIADLQDRRRRIEPHVVLALDIAGLSLTAWLDRIALRFPLGWHAATGDQGSIDLTARLLREAIAASPLPRAVVDFGACGDAALIVAACELVIGHPVRQG